MSDLLYSDALDRGWSPFYGKIRLYDPAKATTLTITPADFRHDAQAILHRK